MSLLLLLLRGPLATSGQKSQVISRVSVQAEASFTGAGTGDIYQITGIREFDHQFEPVQRTTKVTVWRQESGQSTGGRVFRGRLDVEGSPGSALRLLLSNMLAEKAAVSSGGGLSTYQFRPRRSQPMVLDSLRFLAEFEDGPWYEFKGCVIESLRWTVRAQNITNISCEFLCAQLVEWDVNPSWTVVSDNLNPLVASDAVLTIDGSPVSEFIELSCELSVPRVPTRMNRDGQATRFSIMGQSLISGAINEYFGNSFNLPYVVRDGGEFALKATLNAGGGSLLEFEFPRVAPQSGQPGIVGAADSVSQIPFKVLADADLDEASETNVRFIQPTPA